MKICDDFRNSIVDLIEDDVTPAQRQRLLGHLKHCVNCSKEYERIKRLYRVMDSDRIDLPPKEFFEVIKTKARQHSSHPRPFPLKKIARVLVPAFALVAVFLLILKPANNEVEVSIPISILIEDEDVAYVAMQGIVTKDVAQELILIEEQLSFDTEEAIEGLTVEEKTELINVLNRKYAIGT